MSAISTRSICEYSFLSKISSLCNLIICICSIRLIKVLLLEITVSLVPGKSVVTIKIYSVRAALIVLHHVVLVKHQVFGSVPNKQVAAGRF